MSGIQKIAVSILWVLAGISIISAAFFFFGGDDPVDVTVAGNAIRKYTDQVLIWGFILLGLITLITLAFSIMSIVYNKKALKGFGVVVGIAAVLVGISYAFVSKGDSYPLVTVGINLTICLIIIAFIGIIVSAIIQAFK